MNNPGSDAGHDGLFTVILRPLPVDTDAVGFSQDSGRREAVADVYAPWLYRITDLELQKEGKIDSVKALPMERYLFVDVYAADVGGSGDRVCSVTVNVGFVMRAKTADGATLSGPQMTADYFGASTNSKRLAIPLDRVRDPTEIRQMIFDAYDGDGIYFLALGGAFMPRAAGDDGAFLVFVHRGEEDENVYVDDDGSGCAGGNATGGPVAGQTYPCKGSLFTFTP